MMEVIILVNKTHLPVWTDGLTYEEQHLTFWIANNMERVDKCYSLLPIRILGDFFCERKKYDGYVHLIENYFETKKCRIVSQVIPLSYYVAEKAFDLAANEFFSKHPRALDLSFGNLNFNGIYDVEFAIDYETRIKLFQQILDEKIDELCIQDEFFEVIRNPQDNCIPWPTYLITSRLDIKEDDIPYNFPRFLSSHGYPYKPKTQVKVKKNEVYSYFTFIPERIFNLGNQYIKYKQNSEDLAGLFDAAKSRNLDAIKKYIQQGININSIDEHGATAFINYIGSPYEEEQHYNVKELETLIEWGANPAIYGAGTDIDPLSEACLCGNLEAVSFMLKKGVNPDIFPCKDEPCENIVETLVERTHRWAVGDPNINGTPDEIQNQILNMLQRYI